MQTREASEVLSLHFYHNLSPRALCFARAPQRWSACRRTSSTATARGTTWTTWTSCRARAPSCRPATRRSASTARGASHAAARGRRRGRAPGVGRGDGQALQRVLAAARVGARRPRAPHREGARSLCPCPRWVGSDAFNARPSGPGRTRLTARRGEGMAGRRPRRRRSAPHHWS